MTAWIAETLAGSTLLMLVVLALRGPVARAFGARWAYALWALPALRLVVPPMPTLFPGAKLPPVVIFIPTTERLTAPPAVESAASWEWMPFILALWAGGAVIFLTLQWLGYRDFLRRLERSARPGRPPIFGGIRVLSSCEVEGPVALGLIERRIVVPADFLRRYTPLEQRLAMEHELIHHRRGDMWWNFAALLVLAFNWFNPVAWFAFRAFRSDQELACDAAVAAGATREEWHDYASALVKSATRPGLIAACPLTRAGQLKHRLRMMRSHRITPLRTLGGGLAMLSAGALCFAFATPGFSHRPEREVVYLAVPGPAKAPARAFAAAEPRIGARGPALPVSKPRPRPRRLHSERAADALDLAAATPPDLPDLDLPKLAAADLIDLDRLKSRPRPIVRTVQAEPHFAFQVYSAAVTTPSANDRALRERLQIANMLIARLRDETISEGDLQTLRSIVEKLDGKVNVKVLQTIIGETEI